MFKIVIKQSYLFLVCFSGFLTKLNLKRDKKDKNIHNDGSETQLLLLIALLIPQASSLLSIIVICREYHPCDMGLLLPAFNLKASNET